MLDSELLGVEPGQHTMEDVALALWERGFSVIPLGSYGEKAPGWLVGRFDGDQAKADEQWPKTPRFAWKQYQETAASDEDIAHWWKLFPSANVGLVTGAVLVVDADSSEAVEWCQQNMPATPWRVRTGKGMHFYYQNCPVKQFRNTANKKIGVDTRGIGGYVVAALSRHPSGRWYLPDVTQEWDVGDVTELPRFSEEHMRLIASAGHDLSSGRVEIKNGKLSFTAHAHTKASGENVSEGSRNQTATSLAGQYIHQGHSLRDIKRMLDGWNDGNTPPLADGEINTIIASTARTHTANNPTKPVVIEAEKRSAKQIDANPLPVVVEGGADAVNEELGEPEDLVADLRVSGHDSFPSELLERLPGALGMLYEYTVSTALKPQPVLALGAALAGLAAVIGRKVELMPYGARPNIYVMGIAHSGAGKEHPIRTLKKLFMRAGCADLAGVEDIASDSGLMAEIKEQPSCVLLLDEFGLTLKKLGSARNAPHLMGVMDILLKLYSASSGSIKSKAYADNKKNFTIHQPAVSMFATSVPGHVFEAFTGADVTGGFLSRATLFDAGDSDPLGIPKPERSLDDALIEWVRAWHNRPANPNPMDLTGGVNLPRPARIIASTDAQALANRFFEEMHLAKKTARMLGLDALYVRAPENALKFALIRACAQHIDPDQIVCNEADMRWGIQLARHVTHHMVAIAREHIADTPFQRSLKDCERVLKASGARGMTPRDMGRHSTFSKLRPKERQEVLEALLSAGLIEFTNVNSEAGKRRRDAYVWLGN